jgi:hypothetical protein
MEFEPKTFCGYLPVQYLMPTGAVTTDIVKGEPCIQLEVSFQKPTPAAGGNRISGLISVTALLDTGASWNFVDQALVAQAKSSAIETLMNHGVVGSSMITNHEVVFHFRLPSGNLIHRTGAGTIDLSSRQIPWRVILGRKFLQTTKFTYGHTGLKSIGIYAGAR